MNINDLSVSIKHLEADKLLSDWDWLIGQGKRPVLVTKAGDAFLQDTATGEVLFLDTVEGNLSKVANNGEEFKGLLANAEFVMEHFAVNLIAPFIKSGNDVPAGMLFGWKQPPVLGGDFASENLEPTDIEVHFSTQGQIWNQVKDLPEGASIDSINIE